MVSTSLKPFLEAIRQSSHCDPATSPIRAQRRRWRWRQGARGQGDTSPAWQDLLVIGRGERNIATLPIFSHNQHQVIDSRVRRVQCHWSRRRGKLLVTWDLRLGLSQTPWYEVWFINVALSPMGDICFVPTRYYGLWYYKSHNICDLLQNSHPWSLRLKATSNSIIPLWDLFWMTRVVSQLVLGQNVINFNLLTTKYGVKNNFKSRTHSAATSLQVWSLWWNVEASAFKQFLNLLVPFAKP